MSRVTIEVRIQERAARARLKHQANPYWRMISEGHHLGYRRGKRIGTWVARYRPAGSEGNGIKQALGVADDTCEANGTTVLNWKQALDKANKWFDLQASGKTADDRDAHGEEAGPPTESSITVADVVDAYISMRDARETAKVGRQARSTASFKLTPHVLSDKICAVKLSELTEGHLREWQRRLSPMAGSSKQRILTELKAALNDAAIEHRRLVPKDLAVTIKFGCRPVFAEASEGEPIARDNQILPDETIRTILDAIEAQEDEDNFVLAVLLAATGARFSQIVRMNVRDLDLERVFVFVPPSRKGRGKKSGALIRIQVGEDVINILRPFVEGREPTEPLLERWHYRQIKATQWERVGRQPWKTPSEMARWWKKAVEIAGVPGVIPYALRHSSIVRALRANIPIRLVAALHDTSVAMIETHYARWITESLDDIAARAIIPLTRRAA